jgi:streptogramin lyase
MRLRSVERALKAHPARVSNSSTIGAMPAPPIARWLPIAAIALLWLSGAVPASAAVTPAYFDLPAGFTTSFGISAAADGSVWFVANGANHTPGIGRLVPAQASPGTTDGVSTFPTPNLMTPSCCANEVRSVAVDSAHNRVWFSQNEGIVGFVNPESVVPGTTDGMTATMLPGFQDLWDIAVAPSGLAWFSEQDASNVGPQYYGDKIASIDSGLNVHEQENIALQGHGPPLSDQRYDAQPEGITTDSNGKPWFAESSAGLPGYRIATVPANGGPYSEYLITPCKPSPPCSGSNTGTGPSDVAVAPDGSIWFTNQLTNEVGRLDPNAGTFTGYSMATIDPSLAEGEPRAISVAPDGTLWVAEWGYVSHPQANALVRIVPDQPTPTANVFSLGSGHSPIGVAPDTKGNVWISIIPETGPGVIGELAGVTGSSPPSEETPSGGSAGTGTTTTTTTTSTPTPTAALPPSVALRPATAGVARVGPPQPASNGVSTEQICLGPPNNPCAVVYLLSAGEYVTGFPGTRASLAKKKKVKAVILGRTALTLHGGQRRKVTVTLNAKGKRLLKSKGKLIVYFTATQAAGGGLPAKVLKHVKITLRFKH